MEGDFFDHHITDCFGWFTTKDRALKAIEAYQSATMTKFIKFYLIKHDVSKSKVRWSPFEINGKPSSLDASVPYIILENQKLECEYGKDRAISKKEKRQKLMLENELLDQSRRRKFYNVVQESKKRNCEALITLKAVIMFPGMKLQSNTKCKRESTSKLVHSALDKQDETLEMEYRCYVHFPALSDHSGHVVTDSNPFMALLHKVLLPVPQNDCLKQKQDVIDAINESKSFFEGHVSDRFGWFTSMDKVWEAVRIFECATDTKYVKHHWNKYYSAKCKVRVDSLLFSNDACVISDYAPYIVLESGELACDHGEDKHREKLKAQVDKKSQSTMAYSSEKFCCEATIAIKKIIRYPQHMLDDETSHDHSLVDEIRSAVQCQKSDLEENCRCYIYFPASEDHSGHTVANNDGFMRLPQPDIAVDEVQILTEKLCDDYDSNENFSKEDIQVTIDISSPEGVTDLAVPKDRISFCETKLQNKRMAYNSDRSRRKKPKFLETSGAG